MDTSDLNPSARRRFLTQLTGGLAALAGLATPAAAIASTAAFDAPDHDAWMKLARGRHRQLFHAVTPGDGMAMLMAANFLDAYSSAYGEASRNFSAVIGVHGPALPIGLGDAAWAKYELGKRIGVNDPDTKEPAKRNVFAVGAPLSIDTVQKRGVVLLVCNVALTLTAASLAKARAVPQADVYNDLRAAVIPGAVIVPALVVAMNRAQEKGFTYVRAS